MQLLQIRRYVTLALTGVMLFSVATVGFSRQARAWGFWGEAGWIVQTIQETFWGLCPSVGLCPPARVDFWRDIAGQGLLEAFKAPLTQSVDSNTILGLATTDKTLQGMSKIADATRQQSATEAMNFGNGGIVQTIQNALPTSEAKCINISGGLPLASATVGSRLILAGISATSGDRLQSRAKGYEGEFAAANSDATRSKQRINCTESGPFRGFCPSADQSGSSNNSSPTNPSSPSNPNNSSAPNNPRDQGTSRDPNRKILFDKPAQPQPNSGLLQHIQFSPTTEHDFQSGLQFASLTMGRQDMGETPPRGATNRGIINVQNNNAGVFTALENATNNNTAPAIGSFAANSNIAVPNSTLNTAGQNINTTTGTVSPPASLTTSTGTTTLGGDPNNLANRNIKDCLFDIYCLFMRPTYRDDEAFNIAFETSSQGLVPKLQDPPRGAMLDTPEGKAELNAWMAKNMRRAVPIMAFNEHHADHKAIITDPQNIKWCTDILERAIGKGGITADFVNSYIGKIGQGNDLKSGMSKFAYNECYYFYKSIDTRAKIDAQGANPAELERLQTIHLMDQTALMWLQYDMAYKNNMTLATSLATLLQIEEKLDAIAGNAN